MRKRRQTQDQALALFTLYEHKMYGVALAILRDEAAAEDAVMDAFERLLRRGASLPDPRSDACKRLVIRTIQSASIDLYRKRGRERARVTFAPPETLAAHAESSAADAYAAAAAWEEPEDAREAHAAASALIDTLPATYQGVMRERFVMGNNVAQTATHLGISETNVRKRQERAIKMLRAGAAQAAHARTA